MSKSILVGATAPFIQTATIWGNRIDVPSTEKWTYLSFHRFAACPFCNMRTNELVRNYHLFQANNVEIVSIWPSSKDHLLKFVGKEQTPFPIVSDEYKTTYAAYGVTASSMLGAAKLLLHPKLMVNAVKNTSKNMSVDADPMLMPASFLIDTTGIIQMAYYGKHFGDHPKIEFIFNAMKSNL